MPQCKACGAPIVWAKTVAGNAMPLDAQPVDNGNIVLLDGIAHTIKGDLVEMVMDQKRYKSHFATCPEHMKFRRPKGGA